MGLGSVKGAEKGNIFLGKYAARMLIRDGAEVCDSLCTAGSL